MITFTTIQGFEVTIPLWSIEYMKQTYVENWIVTYSGKEFQVARDQFDSVKEQFIEYSQK
jgi:uncharacterized protein YlzI (FlbEa/FlbD family)